ncbi:hypothetical protein AB5J62_00310 [Amycolatopsis sp. cg5]|uniref:hypothetical protein n=1 Tax=Amycolatopsis sp. cg5 TaxID=3238802 RepID=UPI0035251CAA
MSAGSYSVLPAEVRMITSTVESLSSSALSTVRDLETLVIDVLSFAGIGASVASANTALQSQLVGGLSKFIHLINDINTGVRAVVDGYTAADEATARAYGGQQGQQGTQTAQAQAPAGGGAAAPAQVAPQQLDPRVVDSIMRSEGTGGEQGGVREAYGFRESMHNGYDQIMAARNQYGVGSAEERAVVSDLMTANARRAGALNFTDAGTQAAIMSGAHMRGAGGVQAIMNHMAGADIVQSGRLSQDAITHIQGLTPEQFQQEFRDARLAYDREIYGDTTTRQGGHTANWWDRYGNGLTNRYDREQQEFLNLGRQPQR